MAHSSTGRQVRHRMDGMGKAHGVVDARPFINNDQRCTWLCASWYKCRVQLPARRLAGVWSRDQWAPARGAPRCCVQGLQRGLGLQWALMIRVRLHGSKERVRADGSWEVFAHMAERVRGSCLSRHRVCQCRRKLSRLGRQASPQPACTVGYSLAASSPNKPVP